MAGSTTAQAAEAGQVVLAAYGSTGRHFWARVTRVYGARRHLFEVEWLRPRAGLQGGPLYACNSGMDIDETAFGEGLRLAQDLRQPNAAELSEAPAAARKRAAQAGPKLDDLLGAAESVAATAPQASEAPKNPKDDPNAALAAALAAQAAAPQPLTAQPADPFAALRPVAPQMAMMGMQPGFAALGGPTTVPQWPLMGVAPRAGAAPMQAAGPMPVPMAALPAAKPQPVPLAPAAQRQQQPAFADINPFPVYTAAASAPAPAPPTAPTWSKAPVAPMPAASKASFDFISGVVSQQLGTVAA